VMTKWMTACNDTHPLCGSLYEEQELPTRVLDVSVDTDLGPSFIRLHDSNGETGIYAALSYCWGSSGKKTMTTKSNMRERYSGLQIRALPATLLDAVHLCRRLGFRYLWIDSLCIVQDDRDEWAVAVNNMADIYSHSAVTIAVTVAADCSSGFVEGSFPEADPRIPWFDSSTQLSGLAYFRSKSYKWYRLLSSSSALMKRGWTLQERLMAPRILHFGDQMFWECLYCIASEDGDSGVILEDKEENKSDTSTDLLRPVLRKQNNGWLLHEYWSTIVSDYTSRYLTNHMDKLAALAGLARRTQYITGDTYISGLWKSTIAQDLLWKREDDKYLRSPCQYRAPTWSWAALDGKVEKWGRPGYVKGMNMNFFYRNYVEISLHHANLNYSHHQLSLGRHGDKYLDILGSMRRPSPLPQPFSTKDSDIHQRIRDHQPLHLFITEDQPQHNVWICLFDCDKSYRDDQLSLLLVHTYGVFEELRDNSIIAFKHGALVLLKVDDTDCQYPNRECFRRVGIAYSNIDRDDMTVFHNLKPGERRYCPTPWSMHNTDTWELKTVRLL
jgi:hypothetical protein